MRYAVFNVFEGPLLWHFENNRTNDPSIEIDLEEMKTLARQVGFELSVCMNFVMCTHLTNISITDRKKKQSTPHTPVTHRVCSVMYIMRSSGSRPRKSKNMFKRYRRKVQVDPRIWHDRVDPQTGRRVSLRPRLRFFLLRLWP